VAELVRRDGLWRRGIVDGTTTDPDEISAHLYTVFSRLLEEHFAECIILPSKKWPFVLDSELALLHKCAFDLARLEPQGTQHPLQQERCPQTFLGTHVRRAYAVRCKRSLVRQLATECAKNFLDLHAICRGEDWPARIVRLGRGWGVSGTFTTGASLCTRVCLCAVYLEAGEDDDGSAGAAGPLQRWGLHW
jgi:hypothetical protein